MTPVEAYIASTPCMNPRVGKTMAPARTSRGSCPASAAPAGDADLSHELVDHRSLAEARLLPFLRLRGDGAVACAGERQRECRPVPEDALDADGAAHALDHRLHDVEPDARAPEAPDVR